MAGLAADPGACLNFYVAPGTYIAGTYDGSAFVIGEGAVSGYTVRDNCRLYISGGVTASVTAVNDGGELRIRSGGTANGVAVNGGELYVQNGGTATTSSGRTRVAISSSAMPGTTVSWGRPAMM